MLSTPRAKARAGAGGRPQYASDPEGPPGYALMMIHGTDGIPIAFSATS